MDRLQSGLDSLVAPEWMKTYMAELYTRLDPWTCRASCWKLLLSIHCGGIEISLQHRHDSEFVAVSVVRDAINPRVSIRLTPSTGVTSWSRVSQLDRITIPVELYHITGLHAAPGSISRLIELFTILLGPERRRLI